MANVSEDSLRSGGFSPNLYIRRILVRQGGSIKPSKSNAAQQENFVRLREEDGTLTYQANNNELPFMDGSTEVEIMVQAKDVIDAANNRGFWLSDYTGRSKSIIYVLQSTNPALTEELLDGRLFNSPNPNVPAQYKNLVDYEIKEVSLAFSETEELFISNSTNDATGNRISSLNKRVSFLIPQDKPQHLTYFAFVKTPPQNGRRTRYTPHSMVVVEKVIESGLLVDQAFIFRDPENLVWAGPAHLHPEQGWMEGAFHIDTPHDSLRRVAIGNFKVQDERAFSKINGYNIDLSSVPNTRAEVSDAYISRAPNNEASLIFTFDHLSYMIENSKYGKLYANSSRRIQADLLKRSRIANLSILRKRVVPRDSINSVQSVSEVLYDFPVEEPPEVLVASADQGGVLLGQARYVIDGPEYNKFKDISVSAPAPTDHKFYGSIQEVAIDKIGRKRTFAIRDGSISRVSDGKYVYEAQIEVEDAAHSYLTQKLRSYEEMLRLVTAYLELARRNRNFNSKTGEFSRSFIKSQKVDRGFIPVWLASIISLVETLDLLTEINTDEKASLANDLYKLVNPELGTLSHLESYVTALEVFGKRFGSLISNSKSAHTKDKSSISQSSAKVRIENTFAFTEVFDANVTHNTGFQYIDLSDNLSLTMSDFIGRVDSELARYNNNLYTAEELEQNFDFITNQDAQGLVATNTRYSFIAPRYFKVIGTVVDLLSENRDSIDFTSVTATIRSILDNPANRDVDVYIERDAIGLLRKTGTGPTTERLSALAAVFESAAADEGVYIEKALEGSILKTDPLASSQAKSISSEEYLGSSNKFSTSTDKVPANTTRSVVGSSDSLSVLQELFRFKNVATNKDVPQSESLEDISFDLTRNDNFINKRLRPELQPANEPASPQALALALQNLPEQIKLLTRNRGRVYNDSSAMSTTSTDSQTDAFIYNFSMIRVVEYLSGYEAEDARRPVWRRLDSQVMGSARSGLLCRIRSYLDSTTNIGAFSEVSSVPVYNEHFILSREGIVAPTSTASLNQRTVAYSNLGSGFVASSYTGGTEGGIARRLISFENQIQQIEDQIEFITSSITGAPTSSTRRLSGVSDSSEAATQTQRREETTSPRVEAVAVRPAQAPTSGRTTRGTGY